MIKSVKNYLSLFGRVDEKILKAIEQTNRKDFVSENKELAYNDEAISIGYGQTISQPSTVARMISILELKKSDEVLEIGTGSAWNSAIISKLVNHVTTLEIIPELFEQSKQKLKNIRNINIKNKDFRELNKKFNKIIFTAGIEKNQIEIIKNFAKTNLKENGILLCPQKRGSLIIFKKTNNKIIKNLTSDEYVFVPLIL